MSRLFLADFKNEFDHSAFFSWLPAWEFENKVATGAKIRFIRVNNLFSRWTLHCSDEHFIELFNSVGAFNGTAHEAEGNA